MQESVSQRTFSLHWAKKFNGSLPYEIAEPKMGMMWNTSGGSEESRGRICRLVSLVLHTLLNTYQLPKNVEDNGNER